MTKAFEGFEEYIEYLATGKLDGHLDSIQPEDKLKKFRVNLPHRPILLIHDLGKHTHQERIKELFERGIDDSCDIVHLFSVSGSGKTRLSLDGLCSHWGLYVSCRSMIGMASGSNDFTEATEILQSMSTLSTKSPDLASNGPVARRAFEMLLCARIFILKQLVQRLPVNTDVTVARRRWVFAQVLPPHLEHDDKDLFVKVLRSIRHATTDIMRDITRSSMRNIEKYLFSMESDTRLFVVIDEAQVAAEYLNFFRSASGTERRPILREMVSFFQSSQIFKRIILSGTGLSMEMVKYAVGSRAAKEVTNEGQGVFTDVGRFTSEDSSQEVYISRYLNLSKDNVSDRRLLERMKYWFSGRYRLTASLIEIFLYSEDVPRHRVLTSFAERLTGFKITDAIELEAGEPPISPDLDKKIKKYQPLTELDRLFKEGLSNGMELIHCLTDAFMRWTLGSELTSIPIEDKMHEMVALGVGFLDKMSRTRALEDDINLPVYISEPLVVLSLRSLFEKHKWTSRKNWMVRSFRTAVNRSSLGFVLEAALLLVLMENFGGKSSRLADVFHCSEKLGSMKFTLVSLKRVAGNVMQSRPVSWNEGSSDRLGLKAQSPTDVLNFLEDPDGKVFLFPDTHMGGDLLCVLQNPETRELILAVIQSKLTPELIATIWKKALDSVTPELFYTVVADGKQGQYAPVSFPNLENDLKRTLETILGEGGDAPNIAETYRSQYRDKQASQKSASHSTRQTPRFLRVIATPNDEKARQHFNGEDDVAILRWDKVTEYMGSTADSVVKAIGCPVF
ncbi:hypothetical protein F5887DRAFT_1137571 [Amanita rubescens]|nr:hypothetical protein F5887DRAFT_1137571 [Amanita rubescens]